MRIKYFAVSLLLLFMSSLFCLSVMAAGESGFNAGLSVDRTYESAGSFTVTIQHSDVLVDKKPTLRVPCSYAAAKITAPDGTEQNGVIAEGQVCFRVFMGGTYTISSICAHKGQTEIRGAVKESCETNGYTGDAWCLDCETKLITGTVIPAAHLWGEWVINEDGAVRECKNCDQKETHMVEKVEVPVVDEKQEESVSVNIIKTEEKVEVVLDQEELETKLENLVQENTQTTGVIVVDIAALTQVLEEVEVLNHVSIPTAAFTKLEEAAESSSVNAIEVQLTDGAVKFADEALSALSGTEGSSVDVDLSKIEEDVETVLEEQIGANPEKQTALETLKTEATILSAVSVTVVDASTREEIHDFTGNAEQTKANVTIAIAFELGSYKSEGLRVYYLTENGEREEYIPTYSDGKLFIEVPHLSTFIVGYNEAATPVYPLGDANHDGKADSSDAVAILRNLAGYDVPKFDEVTADFNGDNKADSSDAVAILRKLAGY